MRTIVVGDVQGCLAELMELVDKACYVRGRDTLVLAGDLVDRGPESRGVLRYAREMGFICVIGNHDIKYRDAHRRQVAWQLGRTKKEPKIQWRQPERTSFYHTLEPDDFITLEGMVPFYRISAKWAVVHGGCEPRKPLDKQSEYILTHARYIDRATGAMLSLSLGEELYPEKAAFWTELWPGPESIIYGHHVHRNGIAIDTPAAGVQCVGIDTGCCFGRELSAVVLENDRIVQTVSVPSRGVYGTLYDSGRR